jgi:proteasome accessory factor C
VKTARFVARHPQTAKALDAGDIAVPHVEMLAAVAHRRDDLYDEYETVLLDAATTVEVQDFPRVTRRWASLADDELARRDAGFAFDQRGFTLSPTTTGSALSGFLDPEASAIVGSVLDDLQPPEGAADVIERTLHKLEEAAGADGEDLLRLHVSPTPREASAVVPVLESAIAHGHQVEITYHVPSRDQESRRVVDPRGLARVEDLLYLDAWCHTAGGDRAFRVDRIVAATELDSPVADPGARARDLTGGWFTDAETTTVTLRLAPPARWVVEYYPVTGRRPGPDGTIDVDLEVASEEWVKSLLLRLAPHAELLAPAAYADAFTNAARAALRMYEDDGVDSE